MSTVHLLVSPDAGRGAAAAAGGDVRAALAAEGVEVVDITGRDAAASEEAARSAVAAGAGRLVVVGGDGLAHLAVQAVAGSDTVLGVVPVGTGNDFAGALGLPSDPVEAARMAVGDAHPLDAIRVGERWVASVATAGFSVDVNERANRMRFPRGPSRYTVATLLQLPALRARGVTLTVDDVPHEVDLTLLAVANTSDFGGGMKICPTADPGDGLLDITVVERLGRIELLRFFRLVFDGRHLDHPKVTTLRGRRVTVDGDDLAIWGDGEPVTTAAATLEAIPAALKIAR